MSGLQRFRRAERVRESRDYARSRAEGRRVSSHAFAFEITRIVAGTRLGLVVSKRVGGAVVRNRVKRIVREWFRRNRALLPGRVDLVVIARSAAASLGTQQAWSDLTRLAARAPR
ncbi:MAG: ribonuclease P protein component [Myxococcota bacterium]